MLGNPLDRDSRYIEAAVNGFIVVSIYAPNGKPQPGPKFDFKLDWMARLQRHATSLRRSGAPVILAGDFNIVPTDLDIYPTRSWDDDALVQPEPRAAFRRLLGRSWIDSVRKLHPAQPSYTFWSYQRMRWQRDAGLRIDHILVSRTLGHRLLEAGVCKDVRGKPNASDHAPAYVRLAPGR